MCIIIFTLHLKFNLNEKNIILKKNIYKALKKII